MATISQRANETETRQPSTPGTTGSCFLATTTADPLSHGLNATTGSMGQESTVAKAYAAVSYEKPAYAYPFLRQKLDTYVPKGRGFLELCWLFKPIGT